MRKFNSDSTASPGKRVTSHIALLAVVILSLSFARAANAEVRVSGQANALVVETRGATLNEVLSALRASVQFQYRGTEGLNGVVSGTYTGSLSRVVTRLLEGHDYVMHVSANNLELIVFGPRATTSMASRAPAAASAGPQTEPVKECQYKDGDRVIPVEC